MVFFCFKEYYFNECAVYFLRQKKMKEVTLLSVCIQLGLALPTFFEPPCQELDQGPCHLDQYWSPQEAVCLSCPENTFMDYSSHACLRCKDMILPGHQEIVAEFGNSGKNNVVDCPSGFFRRRSSDEKIKNECLPCSKCISGFWAARECSYLTDTLCCLEGMVAVKKTGKLICELPNGNLLVNIIRKARSSEQDNTKPDEAAETNTQETSAADKEEAKTDKPEVAREESSEPESPKAGFSRADEEEPKREMVEFPVWGRILVAGLAAGVFMFYLGVGIPCNACGSLDKLKSLKRFVLRQNNVQSTSSKESTAEDEAKEPMNIKQDTKA